MLTFGVICHHRNIKAAQGVAAGETNPGPACRLDLDSLGGEICFIDWGEGGTDVPANIAQSTESVLGNRVGAGFRQPESALLMRGRLNVTLVHESSGLDTKIRFPLRLIPLEGDWNHPKIVSKQSCTSHMMRLKTRMVTSKQQFQSGPSASLVFYN